MLTREEDDDDREDLAWGRGKTRTFCSLKANSLKSGVKHYNDRLSYTIRFSVRELYAGRLMIFNDIHDPSQFLYSSASVIATICISHIGKICPIHSDVI